MRSNMSKQTFVIAPKIYPRPLEVLGEHAAVLASGAREVGSELFHRLKEDVRSWYELHRCNGATNVVVWAIYLELLLMLVAARQKCSVRHVNMTISMAFIAPALVKAAVEGRLPRGIGIATLRDAPAEWSLQFERLGLAQP